MEIVIGVLSIIILLSSTFVASFFEMENWIRNLLIVGGFIPAIIGMLFGLKIEQTGGTKLEFILAEAGISEDEIFYAQWEEKQQEQLCTNHGI